MDLEMPVCWARGRPLPWVAWGGPTLQCPIEHLGNTLGIMGAGVARALFLLKSFNAVAMIATAPSASGGVADAQSLGNGQVRLSLSTGQNDWPTLHHAVRQRAGVGNTNQFVFLFPTNIHGSWGTTTALTWAYSLNPHPSILIHSTSRTLN